MEYSFKKIIRNDYIAYNAYITCIVFSVFFVIFSVFPVLLIVSIVKGENDFTVFNESSWFFLSYLFYFLAFSAPLIILLIRAHTIKHFQENCSEIDAKIEIFIPVRNKGREIGFKITFSYKYNNENYTKKYSLLKNKHTLPYLDNYIGYGKTVRILVRNDNPKKILIKEVLA